MNNFKMIDVRFCEKFEVFLSNFSFVTLFVSMLGYWIQTSGILLKPVSTNPVLNQSLWKAKLSNGNENVFLDNKLEIGQVGISLANLSLFSLLALRCDD